MDSATEPKRQTRSKAALMEASRRMLARNVVIGFSIDDVVREANVARSTFYNHFTSLEDLVGLTVATVQGELYALIRQAGEAAPDAATAIARGVSTVLRYGYLNPANARVLTYAGPGIADPKATGNQLLADTLERGTTDGSVKVPNLQSAVVSVLGICELGLSRMLDIHHEYSAVRELTHGLTVMVLRCLGVNARQIDKLAREAVRDWLDAPLGRLP